MNSHCIRWAFAFLTLAILLTGCDRNLLRDSAEGNMYVSFRVDGERYECVEKDEFAKGPMRLVFYDDRFFDFHVDCYKVWNDSKDGCLTFTISDTKEIVTGKKYYLGYYSGEAADRVAEPPVFFAEFDGYRSVEGWVKLRSIKRYTEKEGFRIIAGNFEFTARNSEGKTIEIKHGTFDGIY